ncbi:MAG: glucosyltransferase domain-containing protein [Oscillospiraceae bacterium]|nr:glucosyltransferase domain-containing protein [Oscillospiraceae bacterium]
MQLTHQEISFSILMVFLAFLAVHFLAYGPLLQTHFAVDSYPSMYKPIAGTHFEHGRYIGGSIFFLLNAIGVNVVRSQFFFTLWAIGVYSAIDTILFLQIHKQLARAQVSSVTALFLGCSLFTVNVFNLEQFLFPECLAVDPLGMLLGCVAAVLVCNYKNVKAWLGAFVLLVCAVSIYQVNVGHFLVITTVLLVLQYNFVLDKKSFANMVQVIVFAGLSGVVSLIMQTSLSIKGSSTAVNFSVEGLLGNVIRVLRNQYGIWVKGCTLMPYMSIVVMVLVIWAVFIAGAKRQKQLKRFVAVGVLASVLGVGVTFAPHILSSLPVVAQRTMTGVFFVIGMWTIFAAAANKSEKQIKLLAAAAAIFMLVSIVQINRVTGQHMAANQVDYEIGRTLLAEAQQQSQKNGTAITQVAVCRDDKSTLAYPGIDYVFSDTNVKALNILGSGGSVITYVAEKEGYGQIIEVPMPQEIYETYFAGKNWDTVNAPEQVVVMDNTAYICMF